MALLAGQDPLELGPDEFFGFGVDSGSACFTSPAADRAPRRRTASRRIATRSFATLYPPDGTIPDSTAIVVDPASGANVIDLPVRLRRRPIPVRTYGLDADGQPVVLITDFWAPPTRASYRARVPDAGRTLPGMNRTLGARAALRVRHRRFLAGLELMITAVALPSILADLVAPNGSTAWLELRKASWIVNGYLLVYILVMPLAGRLADAWGARRLFLGALVVFVVGSALAGAAQDLDQLIAARLVQAVGGGVLVPGRDGRRRAPVRRRRRGPGRSGSIGALTFLGMAAGPVLGAAILGSVHPEDALTAAGSAGARRGAPRAGLALDLLRQRARSASSPWSWPGPPRPAGTRRAGRAASTCPARPCSASRSATGLVALTLIGSTSIAGTDLDPTTVTLVLARSRSLATVLAVVRALRADHPFLDVRACSGTSRSASAALVSLLTGYALRHGDHRGRGVRRPGPLRRAGRAAPGARRAGRRDRASARSVSGFLVRLASYRVVTLVGIALSVAGLGLMARWTADTDVTTAAGRPGPLRAGLRPERHAALGGRGRGRRPAAVRRRLVGRDRRPDDRHGGRAGHPDRLRLDDDRPPVDPGLCHPRRLPRSSSRRRCATDRCATRSSSRPSSRGPRARPRRSWSACSSWPPS